MSATRQSAFSVDRPQPRASVLERGLFYALAVFGGLALIGAVFAAGGGARSYSVSIMQFAGEDVWVLALGFGLLLLLYLRPGLFPALPVSAVGPRSLTVLAVAVFLSGYAGSFAIMERHPLSIDEFWVLFDARAMSRGHLLAPLEPEWRDLADALQPVFRRDIADAGLWGSAYLPVNAALHAVFDRLADAWVTGPLLAAFALVMLHAIARRLWPDRRDAAFVAVLLLGTSAQFLFTAMTPYAMTAHLAFNLLWLRLFLSNTAWSHAGAMLTGFAATGLHQVVFHPLFAAPFVARLWLGRSWRLAVAYTLAYGAIALFWILFPGLLQPGEAQAGAEVMDFAARIGAMLAGHESSALMLNNFARLVAWQNPLTVVLVIAALTQVRRWPEPLPQLAAGVVLTLVLFAVVMPFQGYGWGYRYMHGLLGSLSLLAAYGWIVLVRTEAERGRALLAACTAFAVLMVPLRAWQANAFVHPYADLARAVERSEADVVVVDPTDIWFGAHLVRNDPFLARPPMLLLNYLDAGQVRDLCAGKRVAVLDYDAVRTFGVRVAEPRVPELHRPHVEEMRQLMSALGCGKRLEREGT